MARVTVLGGGFGGLAAATRLRELLPSPHEVVLVSRDHRFAMGWTKIWDLVGIRPMAESTRDLGALRERGISFVHAEIAEIDPQARGVATSDGDIESDGVVVALGAGPVAAQAAQLDGVVAHDLYAFEALPAARQALAAATSGHIAVAVMGQPFKCPPAPFEAVLAIDQFARDRGVRDDLELTIATPAPSALPVAGPEASAVIADRLAERQITLLAEHLATDVDAASGTVTFDNGANLTANLIFGVPGAAPPDVLATSSLAGDGGWVRPDPRTLATSFDGVYAVGDCTTVPTATAALPKAGVFAAAEGEVAAHNLAAALGSGEPREFDGRGHCYLEFPGNEVAVVEGDFFARPAPDVHMSEPSVGAHERKLAFEAQHLGAWFG